ncbi:MAG: hypothetical protein ACPIOQ_02155, partial [Promethearchaeia archaeon]
GGGQSLLLFFYLREKRIMDGEGRAEGSAPHGATAGTAGDDPVVVSLQGDAVDEEAWKTLLHSTLEAVSLWMAGAFCRASRAHFYARRRRLLCGPDGSRVRVAQQAQEDGAHS